MVNENIKVLIIDDEPQIRKLCKVSLVSCGYKLVEADTGKQGILAAANYNTDIIIVDLGLPDMDGKEVVRQIREWSQTPIIVLTARDQEQEKIAALDAGADDYITKPFGMNELMARMRACMRRSGTDTNEQTINCGLLCMDLVAHIVTVNNQEIKLTPTEYDLLKTLMKNSGKVLTQKQLLQAVWGKSFEEDTHYVRIYIKQLRRKIEPDPTQPIYIITESGVGYRLLDGC